MAPSLERERVVQMRYKLVPHILHTMVYENGELIAILPPGHVNWMALMAIIITDDEPPF